MEYCIFRFVSRRTGGPVRDVFHGGIRCHDHPAHKRPLSPGYERHTPEESAAGNERGRTETRRE